MVLFSFVVEICFYPIEKFFYHLNKKNALALCVTALNIYAGYIKQGSHLERFNFILLFLNNNFRINCLDNLSNNDILNIHEIQSA